MRKLIYFMMMSLDGFVADERQSLDWVLIDEEIHRFANQLEREVGLELYGRRMYEVMDSFWPTADADPSSEDVIIEFSRLWKERPKIVFSSTLEGVAPYARLERGDPVEVVRQLKKQPGVDMSVGGAALAASLIQNDLVDEYQVMINPVLLGRGTRMFPELLSPLKLRLVETHIFQAGVIYLRYQRAE